MVAPTPKPTCGLCAFAAPTYDPPKRRNGKPNTVVVCHNSESPSHGCGLHASRSCPLWLGFNVIQQGIWHSMKPISGTEAT